MDPCILGDNEDGLYGRIEGDLMDTVDLDVNQDADIVNTFQLAMKLLIP